MVAYFDLRTCLHQIFDASQLAFTEAEIKMEHISNACQAITSNVCLVFALFPQN